MGRFLWVALVVIGALCGAGGMWLAERVAPGDLNGADRARVENVVRDYMLAHPELIPQAMEKLQQRDTSKAVAAAGDAIRRPYAGAWIGNPKGDVTLVEFYDYNCGFCRASLPVLDQLVAADPNLRIVFKELPILAPTSRAASRAALAAASQGRFKPFHDALYAAGPVSDATIAAAAQATGVNIAAVPGDAEQVIDDNLSTAGRLGVSGTPTWVVGDQLLTGAQPLDRLQDAISQARAGRQAART